MTFPSVEQKLYKADLNFMKGVAWDGVGAPQMESAKKAGDLISDVSTWRYHVAEI